MSGVLGGLWQSITANPVVEGGVAVAALIVVLLLVFVGLVARAYGRLRRDTREGRKASAGLPDGGLPQVSVNHKGRPGDPVNVELVGTVGQVAAAFAAASWYRADEIDLVTSVRIAVDSVLGRRYSTAPVSNLYLFGRKEDLAFERPGQSVRERDHIRLWNTGRAAQDGRPIWIGGATRDVKVELAKTNHLPTHQIAPDVDSERDLVVSKLAQTGWVVADSWRPGFGKETHGVNGTGDPYFTDGRVAVLTLAKVWVPLVTRQVRGPLVAGLFSRLARGLRWRLPRAGRERARQEVERLRAHVHALAPASTSGIGTVE
jgi:LssY C-terminus